MYRCCPFSSVTLVVGKRGAGSWVGFVWVKSRQRYTLGEQVCRIMFMVGIRWVPFFAFALFFVAEWPSHRASNHFGVPSREIARWGLETVVYICSSISELYFQPLCLVHVTGVNFFGPADVHLCFLPLRLVGTPGTNIYIFDPINQFN
jgi:hypothetical protein